MRVKLRMNKNKIGVEELVKNTCYMARVKIAGGSEYVIIRT